MNVKNLLRLADFIEQHKAKSVGFNMSTYADDDSNPSSDRSGHDCKTVACIAVLRHAVDTGVLDWDRVLD